MGIKVEKVKPLCSMKTSCVMKLVEMVLDDCKEKWTEDSAVFEEESVAGELE